MKYILIAALLTASTWNVAEARGGNSHPIPPSYDYTREKAPGYKKDYCEDSVGNHVMCVSNSKSGDDRFSATYR